MKRQIFFVLLFIIGLQLVLASEPTKVIANWDVVPYQIFDDSFKIGVVAFHETGVHVEFFVNNKSVAIVDEPTYNDRTDVFEYWFKLKAKDYEDGTLNLTAIAWPDVSSNIPKELSTLVLYANANKTLTNNDIKWVDCVNGNDDINNGTELSPFRTIKKAYENISAGGFVYLKAGSCYNISKVKKKRSDYWTTISAAPGLSRGNVVIKGGRFDDNRVKWQKVTIYKDVKGHWSPVYTSFKSSAWFDDVVMFDKHGRTNPGQLFAQSTTYLTNSFIHDISNAKPKFSRNVSMENIGSDVFAGSNDLFAVNVIVRRIDRGDTNFHPDIIQFYHPESTSDNIILYNVKVYDANAQGIFGVAGEAATNVAFVNFLIEKDPPWPESLLTSQLFGTWNHVLLWHCTFVDIGFLIRESEHLSNFNIQNNVFNTFQGMYHVKSLPDSIMTHNHFISLDKESKPYYKNINGRIKDVGFQIIPNTKGSTYTEGNPLFLNESKDDYMLRNDSIAAFSGVPLPGVPADIDNNIYHPTRPSRGAFATYKPPIAEAKEKNKTLVETDKEDFNLASLIIFLVVIALASFIIILILIQKHRKEKF